MTARTGLQLRSLVKPDGELEITLVDQTVPAPGPDEVVVPVELVTRRSCGAAS